MLFEINAGEPLLSCPKCRSVGNGLRLSDAECPPYFCLSCLSRSDRAEKAERPGLLGRLLRPSRR